MDNTDMNCQYDIKKLNRTLIPAILLTILCMVMVFSNLWIGSRTIVAVYLCLIPVALVLSVRAVWLELKITKSEKARSG